MLKTVPDGPKPLSAQKGIKPGEFPKKITATEQKNALKE